VSSEKSIATLLCIRDAAFVPHRSKSVKAHIRRAQPARFTADRGRDLARLTVPSLLIEVATPYENATIGRQAAAVRALVPHARVATNEEPAGETLTLEHRAGDLAALI
jgi:hypothetical protein